MLDRHKGGLGAGGPQRGAGQSPAVIGVSLFLRAVAGFFAVVKCGQRAHDVVEGIPRATGGKRRENGCGVRVLAKALLHVKILGGQQDCVRFPFGNAAFAQKLHAFGYAARDCLALVCRAAAAATSLILAASASCSAASLLRLAALIEFMASATLASGVMSVIRLRLIIKP